MRTPFYTGCLRHQPAGATNVIDITLSTGRGQYAPTAAMLGRMLAAKAHGPQAIAALWPWYVGQYLALLRQRYKADNQLFAPLLANGGMVLCCYCHHPGHCHRALLAWALCHVGGSWRGEAIEMAYEEGAITGDQVKWAAGQRRPRVTKRRLCWPCAACGAAWPSWPRPLAGGGGQWLALEM